MGQHEAGKHSAAGKKRAAEQPRMPKSSKATKTSKTAAARSGQVYAKESGILGKLFGKK